MHTWWLTGGKTGRQADRQKISRSSHPRPHPPTVGPPAPHRHPDGRAAVAILKLAEGAGLVC